MTRNLKGSLLIASMLVVLWTTSSEACHWRRRACQPVQSYSANRGTPTEAPRATTLLARAATPRLTAVTMAAGIPAERPAIPAAGTPSPDTPARVRLRPARLQPGRPRWAGVRDRGAARPGRRRLWPGALTVHRFSDHPAAARRPGPTGSLRAAAAAR